MRTRIEWADETWNPIIGCDRTSPGCDHCYAIGQAHLRAGHPNPKVAGAFAGLTARTSGRVDWTGRINLLPERLLQPLRWRKPRRVFVNSLADLLHAEVPDVFIAHVFAAMAVTPQHTYQVLTKRHGRMRALLNDPEFRHQVYDYAAEVDPDGRFDPYRYAPDHMIPTEYIRPDYPEDDSDWWPLPGVWLGVSVEDQQCADLRIPALLDTPAAVRFISAEPLIGPVDLSRYLGVEWGDVAGEWLPEMFASLRGDAPQLGWVIAGGESGPGARPAHPDWFRTLCGQCQASGTPFFLKQHGGWVPESACLHRRTAPAAFLDTSGRCRPLVDGKPAGAPMARGEAITVRLVGKKAAGRELDGRTWDEYPAVTP